MMGKLLAVLLLATMPLIAWVIAYSYDSPQGRMHTGRPCPVGQHIVVQGGGLAYCQ